MHPVFQVLDALDLMGEIQEMNQEIGNNNEQVQQYKHMVGVLCEKIQVFTNNRGFHVDRATFNEWKEKINTAEERQQQAVQALEAFRSNHNHILQAREKELLDQIQAAQNSLRETQEQLQLERKQHRQALQVNQQLLQQLEIKRTLPVCCNQSSQTLVVEETDWKSQFQQQKVQMEELMRKIQENERFVDAIKTEGEGWKHRFSVLNDSISKPMNERHLEEKLVLAELETIRRLIEGGPSGDAWDHVKTCGTLATAVALKQRIMKSSLNRAKAQPSGNNVQPQLPSARKPVRGSNPRYKNKV